VVFAHHGGSGRNLTSLGCQILRVQCPFFELNFVYRSTIVRSVDMKKKLIRLSAKEDAAITKAAKSDPDSRPLTDKQWAKVKPSLTRPLILCGRNGTGKSLIAKLLPRAIEGIGVGEIWISHTTRRLLVLRIQAKPCEC